MHGLLSGSAVASFAPPRATHDGAVVFVMHRGNVICSCSFPLFLHRILAWQGSASGHVKLPFLVMTTFLEMLFQSPFPKLPNPIQNNPLFSLEISGVRLACPIRRSSR
uniref:Uncharacterized protein n=1 Tax=Populus davidiana TaxID=266767 RepID=A0A6M2EFV6_9ROSI